MSRTVSEKKIIEIINDWRDRANASPMYHINEDDKADQLMDCADELFNRLLKESTND